MAVVPSSATGGRRVPGVRGTGGPPRRLSREDWITGALEAIAAGGLAAVAVEPVAARLGATKGSFYWHFANREELLTAALLVWEQRGTAEVIDELEAIADPALRLRALFARAFGATVTGSVEAALLADAPSPLVAPVLERVTQRRLEYLERIYSALGQPAPQARGRAVLAYTTYLGLFSLRRAAPTAVTEKGLSAALEQFLASPPEAGGTPSEE
ncbi:TetR/AcrR family transcriptional regulator [Frankia canadensis]|nr:TetR/AcrR family transcriptional regulator [Frankia canadensis]